MAQQQVKVSVIVPVYKVEKYLGRCVDSIIAQTYRDFELILVDDGSPDNCGKICDEYAKKYDYIRVLHQQNQGQAAARNNAALIAKGRYITFIDSDDFVTNDYIEYLMGLRDQFDAQIAVSGYVYQYEDKPTTPPRPETTREFVPTEEALTRMNYGRGFSIFPWGKLYTRELVLAHPFPVGMLYEDLATAYKFVSDSTGMAFGNKRVYYWLQRTGSTMHSHFNQRQLDGLTAAEQQLEYIKARYPGATAAATYRCAAKAVELAQVSFASDADKATFTKLKAFMNKYAGSVLKDTSTKRSMRLRIRAMKLGYWPARLVFGIHDVMKKIKY